MRLFRYSPFGDDEQGYTLMHRTNRRWRPETAVQALARGFLARRRVRRMREQQAQRNAGGMALRRRGLHSAYLRRRIASYV